MVVAALHASSLLLLLPQHGALASCCCGLRRGLVSLDTGRNRVRPIALAKPRKVERDFSGNEYDQSNSKEADLEDNETMVLLVQLVRSFLRKSSVKATKAARGMLPPVFAPDLIAFFVNGALLLTLFWVAKALLEVVCSMGSMIFLGILLVRSIWSLIAYLHFQRTEDTEWNRSDERYSASPS